MVEETKRYRVKGSHRAERDIKAILGKDPGICSGFLPKGNFSLFLSESEFQQLKEQNVKVSLDKRWEKGINKHNNVKE